jgi:hypothetical protein
LIGSVEDNPRARYAQGGLVLIGVFGLTLERIRGGSDFGENRKYRKYKGEHHTSEHLGLFIGRDTVLIRSVQDFR